MAEKVSKVIPVAERITNFCEKNFRQNSGIVHSMECDISDEQWKEFAGKALVIINGRDILQYAEEYPIVKYQCSEKHTNCNRSIV